MGVGVTVTQTAKTHLAARSNFSPRDRTGGITFGDFMDFLSVICKGSEEDKLLWAFEFYDTNRDGVISREEMLKVGTLSHRDLVPTDVNMQTTLLRICLCRRTLSYPHAGWGNG